MVAVDEFKPDLILLDLMMPNGDGETVLAALGARGDEARSCSVIVVTSKELSTGEVRQFELATLGVLSKGAELERDLRQMLNEFAAVRRRQSPSRAIARVDLPGDG